MTITHTKSFIQECRDCYTKSIFSFKDVSQKEYLDALDDLEYLIDENEKLATLKNNMEDLLREAIGGAAFQSCFYNQSEIADPCFHCCDWSEWVKKVAQILDIDLPDADKESEE